MFQTPFISSCSWGRAAAVGTCGHASSPAVDALPISTGRKHCGLLLSGGSLAQRPQETPRRDGACLTMLQREKLNEVKFVLRGGLPSSSSSSCSSPVSPSSNLMDERRCIFVAHDRRAGLALGIFSAPALCSIGRAAGERLSNSSSLLLPSVLCCCVSFYTRVQQHMIPVCTNTSPALLVMV